MMRILVKMKLITSFAICLASASAFNKGTPRSLTTKPFKSLAYPPSGAALYSSAPSDTGGDDYTSPSGSAVEELESCKADLVRICAQSDKPSLEQVQDLVSELEMLGEQVGVGQASSLGGLLSGEW